MKIELTMKTGASTIQFVPESNAERRLLALLSGKEGTLHAVNGAGNSVREGYADQDLARLELHVNGGL